MSMASEELEKHLRGLKKTHCLSTEQIFDLLSSSRVFWFKLIDRGITLNFTDQGRLEEVLKATLNLQEGPDCWNREYADSLLQTLRGKGKGLQPDCKKDPP